LKQSKKKSKTRMKLALV